MKNLEEIIKISIIFLILLSLILFIKTEDNIFLFTMILAAIADIRVNQK